MPAKPVAERRVPEVSVSRDLLFWRWPKVVILTLPPLQTPSRGPRGVATAKGAGAPEEGVAGGGAQSEAMGGSHADPAGSGRVTRWGNAAAAGCSQLS